VTVSVALALPPQSTYMKKHKQSTERGKVESSEPVVAAVK